jgi:YfiH family protein
MRRFGFESRTVVKTVQLRNGVLSSTIFEDHGIPHGFTTRAWGNLGFGQKPGDPEVIANRKKLFESEHLTERRLIQPKQVHSNRVIPAHDFVPGIEADATYCEAPEYLLSILTADCLPVLVYHPEGVVAAIHAGWRGLYDEIIPASLALLPSEVKVAIGPSIGACCYEVSQELADSFANKFGNDVAVKDELTGKPHLNLQQVALRQLMEKSDVAELDLAHLCTSCHPELFFSYRRDGSSGRMMSFIGLVR